MRLLFVKEELSWPRSSGHDVHAYHMMRACAALGHDVSLATSSEPSSGAVAGLPLQALYAFDAWPSARSAPPATWLQRKFRDFYGVPVRHVSAIGEIARETKAEATIVVGLRVLPYFAALAGQIRVWYAADAWALHHLSQLRVGDGRMLENLNQSAIKGLYERAHRRLIDRVWVVSPPEQRAMRWIAGMRRVDVLPNGVDSEYFAPGPELPEPRTAVFWGRLDFGPNVQALEWFCHRVWPQIRRDTPDAKFTIIGFRPSEHVHRLASAPGITLMPDVVDLRPIVRRHEIVVLPFVSGGGIKNKLLEAAALARPIVCTPAAAGGLRRVEDAPLVTAEDAGGFARAVADLWRDHTRRQVAGTTLRQWVLQRHTWKETASEAMAALISSDSRRT